jgi:hypothetical protein
MTKDEIPRGFFIHRAGSEKVKSITSIKLLSFDGGIFKIQKLLSGLPQNIDGHEGFRFVVFRILREPDGGKSVSGDDPRILVFPRLNVQKLIKARQTFEIC